MTKDVLVIAEHKEGAVEGITFELLGKGRALADALGVKLAVLVLGHETTAVASSLKDKGADTMLVADNPALAPYNIEQFCPVIAGVVKDTASIMLIGHTYQGIEISTMVAGIVGAALVTNCVDLQWKGGTLTATRPVWAGTVHTRVEIAPDQPVIVSLQKGALKRQQLASRNAPLMPITVNPVAAPRIKILGTETPSGDAVKLREADIIVSVGRGIRDKANIESPRRLAEALKGVLACSRPIADFGWLPQECEVGISGSTVEPKVYLALGISGASQHIAGMSGSKVIIAVNKDPNAPIFRIADYGVAADIADILPALFAELGQKS